MQKNPLSAFLVALLVALVLSGCKTNVSREDAIEQALILYEQAMRWQSPRQAYQFLRPDIRPTQVPDWIDNIRVVGYETLDPPVEIEKGLVVQRVEIKYVNQQTQIMYSLVDDQVWTETEDGKSWERANPIPLFPL